MGPTRLISVLLAGALLANAAFGAADAALSEVAAPPEDQSSIALSGRTRNPNPEAWLKRIEAKGAPWWIGPTGELLVRNVSQATLTPFLPERSKATGAAMIVAPGGGTLVLGMDLPYQVARWLNARGIAAFVLKYRLVPTPKDPGAFLKIVAVHRCIGR